MKRFASRVRVYDTAPLDKGDSALSRCIPLAIGARSASSLAAPQETYRRFTTTNPSGKLAILEVDFAMLSFCGMCRSKLIARRSVPKWVEPRYSLRYDRITGMGPKEDCQELAATTAEADIAPE